MSTQATDPQRLSERDSESGVTDDAQAKAHEVAEHAQEQAQALVGQAQDRIRDQVEQRSAQAGEQLHQQASDLRSVSEALRGQGKDGPAQLADRLAAYSERAGSYLRETNADSLLSDAEDYGREKPAAVAAGALAIGFGAARLLKASGSRRYASRQSLAGAAASSPGSAALTASQPSASTTDLSLGTTDTRGA
jgi:hypothetical protein